MASNRELENFLCDFRGSGEPCEDCGSPIEQGAPVYFFSDGWPEPRDGTYVCISCAEKMIGLACQKPWDADLRPQDDV